MEEEVEERGGEDGALRNFFCKDFKFVFGILVLDLGLSERKFASHFLSSMCMTVLRILKKRMCRGRIKRGSTKLRMCECWREA